MKKIFRDLGLAVSAAFAASGALAEEASKEESTTIQSFFDKISPANLLDSETNQLFAGHRSHQSHESHGSHSSHYSHRSSSYAAPPIDAPDEQLEKTVQVQTSDPLGQDAKPAETYASQRMIGQVEREDLIRRVQLQLTLMGRFDGPIDGVLADSTRVAIDQLKAEQNIASGKYLDAETLNLLGVPAS